MAKYVMALDAGTTSNRCILFNESGDALVNRRAKEFRQFFPNPGWVEHDANGDMVVDARRGGGGDEYDPGDGGGYCGDRRYGQRGRPR